MGKIKQLNVAKKISQEDFQNGIGGVPVLTPKQKLIEAVNKIQNETIQTNIRPSLAPMTDEQYWTEKICDKFLDIIEEIMPNE